MIGSEGSWASNPSSTPGKRGKRDWAWPRCPLSSFMSLVRPLCVTQVSGHNRMGSIRSDNVTGHWQPLINDWAAPSSPDNWWSRTMVTFYNDSFCWLMTGKLAVCWGSRAVLIVVHWTACLWLIIYHTPSCNLKLAASESEVGSMICNKECKFNFMVKHCMKFLMSSCTVKLAHY